MGTLIDGYNLLHASGFIGRNVGPKTLERARHALLNFLVASLSPEERLSTTVVFDAKTGPSGLPPEKNHDGLKVRYAVGFPNADALIEELILADSSPRRLVVVSSDHYVQRAARRRRATAVDSDDWHGKLCRQLRTRTLAETPADHKPVPSDIEADVAYWLSVFDDVTDCNAPPDASQTSSAAQKPFITKSDIPDTIELDLRNPFPPGLCG